MHVLQHSTAQKDLFILSVLRLSSAEILMLRAISICMAYSTLQCIQEPTNVDIVF